MKIKYEAMIKLEVTGEIDTARPKKALDRMLETALRNEFNKQAKVDIFSRINKA